MLPVFFFYIIMLPMLVSAQVTCESCGFTGILLSFFSVSFDELINSSGNDSHFASHASCRVSVSSKSMSILASCKVVSFLLSSDLGLVWHASSSAWSSSTPKLQPELALGGVGVG